jgi:hypothetical protein
MKSPQQDERLELNHWHLQEQYSLYGKQQDLSLRQQQADLHQREGLERRNCFIAQRPRFN